MNKTLQARLTQLETIATNNSAFDDDKDLFAAYNRLIESGAMPEQERQRDELLEFASLVTVLEWDI